MKKILKNIVTYMLKHFIGYLFVYGIVFGAIFIIIFGQQKGIIYTLILVFTFGTVGLIENYLRKSKKKKIFEVKNINLTDAKYFREIPCNGDLSMIYYIVNKYGINNDKSNIFGAYILKFIFSKKITVISNNDGELKLDISKLPKAENLVEHKIKELLKISVKDGIVNMDDFKNSIYKHSNRFLALYQMIENQVTKELYKKKIITIDKKENFVATPLLDEYAMQIMGLKKFLLDFSQSQERKVIEVNLWGDYLVFATLLGIADKVESNMKEMDFNFKVLNFSIDFLEVLRKLP